MAARNSAQSFEQFCQRIEAEFGESAVDVIRGMREQRQSWATIAGALECSEKVLRTKWARRGGWSDGRRNFVDHWQDSPYTLEARARARGYSDLSQMLTDYYMAGRTRLDAARDIQCSPRSFNTALGGALNLPPRPPTQAQISAWRDNARRVNAKRWPASSMASPSQ